MKRQIVIELEEISPEKANIAVKTTDKITPLEMIGICEYLRTLYIVNMGCKKTCEVKNNENN